LVKTGLLYEFPGSRRLLSWRSHAWQRVLQKKTDGTGTVNSRNFA
jgi:hypothetical protein